MIARVWISRRPRPGGAIRVHAEIWLSLRPGVSHDAIITPRRDRQLRGWTSDRAAVDWARRTLDRLGVGSIVWMPPIDGDA